MIKTTQQSINCGGGVNHNSNYNGTTNISGATIMPINNTQQSINCGGGDSNSGATNQ